MCSQVIAVSNGERGLDDTTATLSVFGMVMG